MGSTDSYGWRGRVGMVKPSPVIDTNAHEFYLMAPEGLELFVTSWGGRGMLQEHFRDTPAQILETVPLLVDHQVDVIVQAGIPHITALGWEAEEALRNDVAKLCDVPFITDIGICIDAMKLLGSSRVLVISPIFDDEASAQIASYLEHFGITLVASARVQDSLPERLSPPLIPLEDVYRVARALYAEHAKECDGIWITGAAMPSVAIIADLEEEIHVPVVSSAQALMWGAVRSLGIHEPLDGFGRLYREPELTSTS